MNRLCAPHRLGHRKPDTTLRVYAHQWKERDARRSQIGKQLGQLFDRNRELQPQPSRGSRSRRVEAMLDQYGFNHLGDAARCIDCPAAVGSGSGPGASAPGATAHGHRKP
jgi:hypothetical protein